MHLKDQFLNLVYSETSNIFGCNDKIINYKIFWNVTYYLPEK